MDDLEQKCREAAAKLGTELKSSKVATENAEARLRSAAEASRLELAALRKDLEAAESARVSATAGLRAEYEIQIAGLKAEASEWRTEAETWQAKAEERKAKADEWRAKADEWKAMSELAADLVPDEPMPAVAMPPETPPLSPGEVEDYIRTIAAWENHVQTLSSEYDERRREEERWRTSMETELKALRANLSDRNDRIAKLEADAALLSHVRQSMRERQTRIDGLELQVRHLRDELSAVRANLADRNERVAKLEADAALLSHVRQSMRERQTQIDGLKLQLQAARASGSPAAAEAEIHKLQERVRDLEAEKNGEDRSQNLQLRLRVATLKGIRFLPDSAEIIPDSIAAIDNAAIALSTVKGVHVEIAGHTDNIGDEAHNVRLSQQRAETVRDYLISRGVRAAMLTAIGYGGSRPIADNSLDDGRFANRRIDFIVR